MKIKPIGKFLDFILPGWVAGITLAPFGIYISHEAMEYNPYWYDILEHEEIHWKQQMEMLIIPFYLWYFGEWLLKLFKYGGQSYVNISFEREARDWANLENRKKFNFIKYL